MTPNYVPYLLHIFVRVTYLFLIIMVSGKKIITFGVKGVTCCFLMLMQPQRASAEL